MSRFISLDEILHKGKWAVNPTVVKEKKQEIIVETPKHVEPIAEPAPEPVMEEVKEESKPKKTPAKAKKAE